MYLIIWYDSDSDMILYDSDNNNDIMCYDTIYIYMNIDRYTSIYDAYVKLRAYVPFSDRFLANQTTTGLAGHFSRPVSSTCSCW